MKETYSWGEGMSLSEQQYTSYLGLDIWLGTWNVNGKKVDEDISAWLFAGSAAHDGPICSRPGRNGGSDGIHGRFGESVPEAFSSLAGEDPAHPPSALPCTCEIALPPSLLGGSLLLCCFQDSSGRVLVCIRTGVPPSLDYHRQQYSQRVVLIRSNQPRNGPARYDGQ